jgi:hypothetical protein
MNNENEMSVRMNSELIDCMLVLLGLLFSTFIPIDKRHGSPP